MKKIVEVDPLDRTFSPKSLKGKGVRGKYLLRVTKGSNLVRLSPEVAKIFPSDAAVNNALRSLAELSKSMPELSKQPKRTPRKRVAA
jgi:hypothetical protein